MPQNDWRDALESLVRQSGGSLGGSGGGAAIPLPDERSGGEAAGGMAAMTESVLSSVAGGWREQAGSLGERLSELARVVQSQTRTVEDNAAALAQSTASRAADAVKSAVSTMGGGLGALSAGPAFLPLISGIMKLFGGGKTEAPPPLISYLRPAPVQIEAGITSDSDGGIHYDASGRPRLDERRTPAPAPQITVNVQAIDSRSFLDHSSEIARAVRTAMLESHILTDVVNEL